MKSLFQYAIAMLLFTVLGTSAPAQLPGPGNIDWVTKWEKLQPTTFDESDPNAWMYGDRMYTGLAYDETRDLLYVVHPAPGAPQILILDPETGAVTGAVNTLSPVITGGLENGKFALYKVDVDNEGRIFACNIISPSADSTKPFRVYRWDTPSSDPQMVCEYYAPSSIDLLGTSFAVAGGLDTSQGNPVDSVRIFVSTSITSSQSPDDALLIFAVDPQSGPTFYYRHVLTIRNTTPAQERLFGAGIAPLSSESTDEIWVSSTSGKLRAISQYQSSGQVPQIIDAVTTITVPQGVTGLCGPIATGNRNPFYPPSYQDPFIVCGDAIPSSQDTAVPNTNLKTRTVVYEYDWNHTQRFWSNRPPGATPLFYNRIPSTILGSENWIADIDYCWWKNPDTSQHIIMHHQQVFYLLSNNGIVSWMERDDGLFPVELSSFTAHINNGTVQLAWSTASETNNYGFEIERSFGDAWERIGFVEGHGTTTVQQEYTYSEPLTPAHHQAGVIQYRLRQVDFDGAYEYSPIVEVTVGAPSAIALHSNYPNPFSGSTSISYSVPAPQPVTLSVYNTLGQPVRVVEQEAVQGRNTVQLAGLHPGMYMVVLRTASGAVTRRMISR